MTDTQQGQGYTSNNAAFVGNSSIEYRLDTTDLIKDIRDFLNGTQTVVYEKDGEIVTKELKIGDARLNKKGVQAIVSRLKLFFSPAVVQGNWKEDRWAYEITTFRESIAIEMMMNAYKWELVDSEYKGIIDAIMSAIKGYSSRLIDNKERESYAATIRSTESNTLRENKGFLGFGGN